MPARKSDNGDTGSPLESPISPAVEKAGVTPTKPGEIVPPVPPESVPGVKTGTPAEGAPDPLRGIVAPPADRDAKDTTPDAHADPPPGEGLTPEDELREEHIRRKMASQGGTPEELVRGRLETAQAHLDTLQEDTRNRLAKQMQLAPDEVDRVRLMPVDLNAPPILGHKLASHDEHRLASDDDRSGVDKVRAAVLEARYPVTVTQAEFEEALTSDGFTDDNRMEARQMARRNDIYLRGR
jgi:hypothetical protein